MMGVFAEFERAMIQDEFERAMIQERSRPGPGRRPRSQVRQAQISARKERALRDARAEGLSIRQIAARCGVSVGTAHNMLKG